MAAKYRKIDPRIWKDEKFRSLEPQQKLVAMYCITAQSNRIGIFSFSIAMAAEETNLTPEEFRRHFDTVCHTLSWGYHEGSRVLYFPTWWKYNCPDNVKAMKGLLRDIDDLPQTPLLKDFCSNRRYLSDTLYDTLREGMPYGMAYQEQEQEQEQEQDKPPASVNEIEEAFVAKCDPNFRQDIATLWEELQPHYRAAQPNGRPERRDFVKAIERAIADYPKTSRIVNAGRWYFTADAAEINRNGAANFHTFFKNLPQYVERSELPGAFDRAKPRLSAFTGEPLSTTDDDSRKLRKKLGLPIAPAESTQGARTNVQTA